MQYLFHFKSPQIVQKTVKCSVLMLHIEKKLVVDDIHASQVVKPVVNA